MNIWGYNIPSNFRSSLFHYFTKTHTRQLSWIPLAQANLWSFSKERAAYVYPVFFALFLITQWLFEIYVCCLITEICVWKCFVFCNMIFLAINTTMNSVYYFKRKKNTTFFIARVSAFPAHIGNKCWDFRINCDSHNLSTPSVIKYLSNEWTSQIATLRLFQSHLILHWKLEIFQLKYTFILSLMQAVFNNSGLFNN